ncbi:MAG: hypothetical protein CMJ89_06075 [Planctomycetes bacterium]|jgi:hypothetical protein|nr:hypothetical protein [Planctomycetota bacterium]
MKIHRRNRVLLALVVLCLGLDWLMRPQEAPAQERTPVFPQLDPRRAVRVLLEGAEGEEVAAVELVRNGEEWKVASLYDFPAHAWIVEDLLARLRGLSHNDLVSNDPEAFKLFGFDGSERRLRIEDEHGKLLAQSTVARGPEERGSHVRPMGVDEVYRAPALRYLDLNPERYVQADLVDFDPAQLEGLELEFAPEQALAHVERMQDGRWRKSNGELLSPAKVDPLIAWSSHLYLLSVAAGEPDPQHGLSGGGWARLRLILQDGECELIIGHAVPAEQGGLGERYATNLTWETPWVVTVSALTAERLSRLAQALAH